MHLCFKHMERGVIRWPFTVRLDHCAVSITVSRPGTSRSSAETSHAVADSPQPLSRMLLSVDQAVGAWRAQQKLLSHTPGAVL